MNTISSGNGNFQSMIANDQVFNPNGVGLDLNNQEGQGGLSSRPSAAQFASRPRFEFNSIKFSQSPSHYQPMCSSD